MTLQVEVFSPHTRGWPGECPCAVAIEQRSPRTRGDGPSGETRVTVVVGVLPAHAGMARDFRRLWIARIVLPAHAGMARI